MNKLSITLTILAALSPSAALAQSTPPSVSADSFPTIQDAVNKIAGTNGTVYLSPKTYLVSRTIMLPSRVQIVGKPAADGTMPIVKLANGANQTLFYNKDMVNGNTGIRLAGFRVDGNRLNQGTGQVWGMYVDRLTNSTFENLIITNCVGSAAWLRRSNNNVFRNCHFDSNGKSTTFQVSGINLNDYCNDNLIEGGTYHTNNGFTGYDGNGIRIGDYCERNTIRGVAANRNGRRGIKVQGRANLVVGNTMDGNLQHTLLIGGPKCDANILQDNIITNSVDASVHVSGGFGSTTFNNLFLGNRITGGLHGIHIYDNAQSCTITGNTIKSTRGNGVYVRGSSDNVIDGNTITNNGTCGVCVINDQGRTSARNQITNNDLRYNQQGGLKITTGAGTASNNLL